MNVFVFLGLAIFAVSVVSGENCNKLSDCTETTCTTEHGWWLHCTGGMCLCSHDSYTGKPCADGQVATCQAAHGSRCQDNGLYWHCLDSVCHCSKVQG